MRRRASAGFTLVEVLVAFTVAMLLLAVLLRGFSSGVGSGQRSEAYAEATIIAESTLEALGTSIPIVDGEVDRRDGRFAIAARVSRYNDENGTGVGPLTVPYELAVSVSWLEGARRQSVALSTLRLGAPPTQ